MNDFTRDELLIILLDMRFYAKQSKPMNESPSHGELREKIEDMIENYDQPCGHINCRRVSLLDGHEYDICANCQFIRIVR